MNTGNSPQYVGSESDAPGRKRNGPFRGFVVWLLIILACICAFGGSFALWVKTTTLNTENFVNTVAPLVQDNAVARAVSIKAVDIMWEAYNLEGKIEGSLTFLPEEYQFLGESASTGAKTAAQMAGEEILKSEPFQAVWKQMLTEAHSTGIRALKGEGPVTISEEGEAVLDLGELIDEIKAELEGWGLTFLGDVDASGAGEVVLFKSRQLGFAEIGISAIEVLSWLLPVLALTLFVAAVLVSVDNRKTLLGSGIALAGTMAALLISLWVSKVVTLSRLSPVNSAAANVIWNHLESGLKWVDIGLLILGVVVAVVCILAGPYNWAVKLRGLFKPRPKNA
ncbi:MAG: hypothetical protein JXA49_03235 [Actinobacteria bacterium]|nr:hypothetical protein [Actinomycetota bacterium]